METTECDFSDITPIPLITRDSSEEPQLCDIMYSDEYKELISYLRALMKANEYSERALYVTDLIINKVAAHYTVWSYRYNIISNLNDGGIATLQKELEWCEDIAINNQKNYQIWHYRSLIIELSLKKYPNEKFSVEEHEYPILQEMLDTDSKNYHVWSYRRWLVEKFNLFENPLELQFVNDKLDEDIRNNSAWNHRFFLKFGSYKLNRQEKVDSEVVTKEIEYAREKISRSHTNPSSWNYLRGIYRVLKLDITELKDFVSQFTNLDEENKVSVYAYEVLAEIYKANDETSKCEDVYELLASELDPVRVNYWRFKKSNCVKLCK